MIPKSFEAVDELGSNDLLKLFAIWVITQLVWRLLAVRYTLAGVFYNVKNGSSFITSKSLSENLSNQNKHLWRY